VNNVLHTFPRPSIIKGGEILCIPLTAFDILYIGAILKIGLPVVDISLKFIKVLILFPFKIKHHLSQ
jgi:hypothetical protein